MAANIIRFHEHKNIEILELTKSKNEMKFNVLVNINNITFTLRNVMIKEINKNKIRFQYDTFFHHNKANKNLNLCPFCNGVFDDSVCSALDKEKDELFTKKISQLLFFPIMSFYYNELEGDRLQELSKVNITKFEPLFMGISEGTYIQCIFKLEDEILLFQDYLDSTKTELLPLIFFYEKELSELHLYIELLMPEKLLPIITSINNYLMNTNVEYFDTTGIGITELYSDFIKKYIK